MVITAKLFHVYRIRSKKARGFTGFVKLCLENRFWRCFKWHTTLISLPDISQGGRRPQTEVLISQPLILYSYGFFVFSTGFFTDTSVPVIFE